MCSNSVKVFTPFKPLVVKAYGSTYTLRNEKGEVFIEDHINNGKWNRVTMKWLLGDELNEMFEEASRTGEIVYG